MNIVEGECVPNPSSLGGMGRPPKPIKQDTERLVTRVDRFVHVAVGLGAPCAGYCERPVRLPKRPEKRPRAYSARPARGFADGASGRRPPCRRDREVGSRQPAVHDSRRQDRPRERPEGDQPASADVRSWNAFKRISVKRANAEEGK